MSASSTSPFWLAGTAAAAMYPTRTLSVDGMFGSMSSAMRIHGANSHSHSYSYSHTCRAGTGRLARGTPFGGSILSPYCTLNLLSLKGQHGVLGRCNVVNSAAVQMLNTTSITAATRQRLQEVAAATVSGQQPVLAASVFRKISNQEKVLYSLIAVNVGIFALWQASSPRIQWMMRAHFMSSGANLRSGRFHTLITSAFSHESLIHLAMNMFVLYNFAPAVMLPRSLPHEDRYLNRLSPTKFMTLYLGSAFTSSVVSLMWSAMRRSPIPSLGASGALFGVLTFYFAMNPQAEVSVFFVPMTADMALQFSVALNVLGVLWGLYRFTSVDWMAHLGGMAFGWLYTSWRMRLKR